MKKLAAAAALSLTAAGCGLAVPVANAIATQAAFTAVQGDNHTILGRTLGLGSKKMPPDQEACVIRLMEQNHGVNDEELLRLVNRPVAKGGCLP